jgi:subtilase family serine protease
MMLSRLGAALWGAFFCLSLIFPVFGADTPARNVIAEKVPAVVSTLAAIGSLPATNQLHFVVSLPLRDQAGLNDLLHRLYTPGSPAYRQFLTPAQFGAQFGPAASDYQTLLNFLRDNGLTVARTYADHTMVEVTAPVEAIEKTFQTHLRVYHHPKEARTFYAPDGDLSVDASLPVKILDVSGLDNFALPQPVSLHNQPTPPPGGSQPNAQPVPTGDLAGRDFRFAYLPASRLAGTGQAVALLEFDGYYSNDIAAYEADTDLPAVALTNVPVNGGVLTPGGGVEEVSLDIEMVISMATNVSKVLVYEAPSGTPWQTILKQIADDDSANQVSSSWYSGGGSPQPSSEQIFQQMAAQGQSFFEACGDYDAYVGGVSFPQDSPNITLVGGTLLTTVARSGARATETVWNRGLDSSTGDYVGTGGCVSTTYSIPVWQ